jgi:hypothetical protein
MEEIQSKQNTVTRPKDPSLGAYKVWIMELCRQLTTKEICILFTEEEWRANWKAYWNEQPT